MENEVYIVKCPDYEHIEEKLSDLMTMMGGIDALVRPGEKIVLKVNLLSPRRPETAVTTHPAVVAAVAKMIKGAGANPLIADSPGGFNHNQKTLLRFYEACGLSSALEGLDVELNLDTTHRTISYPEGRFIKRFEIITPVVEADCVFNLCKLKTHAFMHMTGAVKNSFGVIPGLLKAGYHAKLREKEHFANMLLDLSEYVSPRISIMDAIMAMEGEGPGASGVPRQVGLLLASRNPLALDVVAGEIIGLRPEDNPVLMEAEKRGLYPTRIEDIRLSGAEVSDLRVPDYLLPRTIFDGTGFGSLSWWQKILSPLFKTGMSVRPLVKRDECTACGTCRDACPVGAIRVLSESYAFIDEKKCVRCYCCHEMCPNKAIQLHESLLFRLVNK